MPFQRRAFLLVAGAGLLAVPARPARATPAEVAALIRALAGDVAPRAGRIKLDLPLLVENGNVVAMTVGLTGSASGPGLARQDRLTDIHVFAEGNPRPGVAHFRFGPRSGAPRVATRIRLSTSQTVHAVAVFADGSCWTDSVDLLVTLSACLDE